MTTDIVFDKEEITSSIKSICFLIVVVLLLIQLLTYDSHETDIKEKAIIDFVEGTITYDTLSMDKNGKILKIELIEKK